MHSLQELIELNDSTVDTPVTTPDPAALHEYNRQTFGNFLRGLTNFAHTSSATYQGWELPGGINFGMTGTIRNYDPVHRTVCFVPDDEAYEPVTLIANHVYVGKFNRSLSQIIQESQL